MRGGKDRRQNVTSRIIAIDASAGFAVRGEGIRGRGATLAVPDACRGRTTQTRERPDTSTVRLAAPTSTAVARRCSSIPSRVNECCCLIGSPFPLGESIRIDLVHRFGSTRFRCTPAEFHIRRGFLHIEPAIHWTTRLVVFHKHTAGTGHVLTVGEEMQ